MATSSSITQYFSFLTVSTYWYFLLASIRSREIRTLEQPSLLISSFLLQCSLRCSWRNSQVVQRALEVIGSQSHLSKPCLLCITTIGSTYKVITCQLKGSNYLSYSSYSTSTHVISHNARTLRMLTVLKKRKRTRRLSEVTSPTTASFSDTSMKSISVYCVGELVSHLEYQSSEEFQTSTLHQLSQAECLEDFK